MKKEKLIIDFSNNIITRKKNKKKKKNAENEIKFPFKRTQGTFIFN